MTQSAKKDYLEVLWASLLKQNFDQRIEIVLFSEEGFTPSYPEKLNSKFLINIYFYKKPFNIGFVRNSIVRAAQGKYLAYLDDDVAISPLYFQTLAPMLEKEKPAVLAGLTYQVFRRPHEFLEFFHNTAWEELIEMVGRRDFYSRRIGRYSSENLTSSGTGDFNWLGCIGRNMVVQRILALKFPFVEFKTMGFEDIEFAYRLCILGKKILLKNDLNLACLHIFHDQNHSKANDYLQTFQALIEQKRLPTTVQKLIFRD